MSVTKYIVEQASVSLLSCSWTNGKLTQLGIRQEPLHEYIITSEASERLRKFGEQAVYYEELASVATDVGVEVGAAVSVGTGVDVGAVVAVEVGAVVAVEEELVEVGVAVGVVVDASEDTTIIT